MMKWKQVFKTKNNFGGPMSGLSQKAYYGLSQNTIFKIALPLACDTNNKNLLLLFQQDFVMHFITFKSFRKESPMVVILTENYTKNFNLEVKFVPDNNERRKRVNTTSQFQ